jgi:hypothetical protein
MLLTIAWGGSVWAGRCDIGPSVRACPLQRALTLGICRKNVNAVKPCKAAQCVRASLQGRATDKQLTQGASLTKTGITTDKFTPLNAVIMSATVMLYLVIQVP